MRPASKIDARFAGDDFGENSSAITDYNPYAQGPVVEAYGTQVEVGIDEVASLPNASEDEGKELGALLSDVSIDTTNDGNRDGTAGSLNC